MLYAVLPVTESIDWLFHGIASVIVLLLAAAVIVVIRGYIKDKAYFVSIVRESSEDVIYDVVICVAGLVTAYSMNLRGRVIIWLIFLLMSIVEFFVVPRNDEQ